MADVDTKRVKDYLSQVRYLTQNIDSRQRELDSIRQSFLKVSTVKEDKVQEGGGVYDDKYLLLFEIGEEINAEVDVLINKQREIRKQIDRLDDTLSVIVLRERYLNGQQWDDIADSMGQSVRNIHNLHGKALRQFGELFAEEIVETV